ncbi:MAG: outer membrane lipoprotein-sorting protein, partial [Candidatus Dadabacteria bacterium]
MRALFTLLSLVSIPFLFPTSLLAISVEEVVAKANHAAYYQGNDGRAHVTMIIRDKNGKERKRQFVILRKNLAKNSSESDGDQDFYLYFTRPADVSKTAFMVHKHVKGEDDRWLYLPALDLVKRIAATDKRTSFMGSHFFYEDISGRNPNADTHSLEETEDYYIIKSVPKSRKGVE